LAAITSLYKTYYEVFKGGELLQHLIELHAVYGPVIRIAPNELHFNHYSAYADIYSVGSQFTKEPKFYQSFGADCSTFGAIHPQDSRSRRNMLHTLFSRRAVLNIEPVIQEKVRRLVFRLAECHERKPANMFLAFRCTSMDIIATYCFARCDNSLNAEDFHDPLLMTMQSTISFFWLIKFLPFLIPLVAALPERLVASFSSQFLALFRLRNLIANQIDRILNDQSFFDNTENWTIYHHLLGARVNNKNTSRQDLFEEALSLLQAGSDTVGNTCTIGTFYILNDPDVHSRLLDELQDVWPDKNATAEYTVLEKLPYLTAVIKESLRMSHGIVTPLPRIVGPTNADIAGHNIPAGTVVGVSAICLHNDDSIFPDPLTFSPERWMQPKSRELEKSLVPFSKGPRMCLGINLAWCELYLIFGNIFRRLDMEIHNTTVDDFRRFKDFFIPIHQGRQFHILAKEKTI